MQGSTKIEISTSTILKTLLILVGVWLLFVARSAVVLLIFAIILAAALEPWVDRMERRKFPRALSVLLAYLLLLGLTGLLLYLIVPAIAHQLGELLENLPNYEQRLKLLTKWISDSAGPLGIQLQSQNLLQNLGSALANSGSQLLATTVEIFKSFVALVMVLAMAFYMLVIKDGMDNFLLTVLPAQYQAYGLSLFKRIKQKIGNWLAGQLIVMLIVFVIYFSILYLLGIPYALIIAILGGLLEIVPYIGPIVAGVLAATVALLVSPMQAVLVLLAYTVAHQLEANFVVPKIMHRAVGLNPVLIILALLIGLKVGGILGAILAVPLATALGLWVKDLASNK